MDSQVSDLFGDLEEQDMVRRSAPFPVIVRQSMSWPWTRHASLFDPRYHIDSRRNPSWGYREYFSQHRHI